MVSSKILRAFLDDAMDACEVTDNTLREQLRAYETDACSAISGGSIASTSANGRHVALATGYGSLVTPVDIVEAWRRLVDTFDTAASELGIVPDGTGGTDQTIKAQMMTLLREIKGTTSNFMYLSK